MDKIICVGKNYLAHAKELGDVVPEYPVLFLKPASVMVQAASWHKTLTVRFPDNAHEQVQPECEIALLLKVGGYRLTHDQAQEAIAAVTIGLEMTLRTTQSQLKQQGHPWTCAKVFPDAAILAPWLPIEHFNDYLSQEFSLSVNGTVRQRDYGNQMRMTPTDLLVYISQFFPLCAGDVVFTGTPAGVTNIAAGDSLLLRWGEHHLPVQF